MEESGTAPFSPVTQEAEASHGSVGGRVDPPDDQDDAGPLELQKQLLEQKGALIHREQQRLLREQTSACLRDVGVLQHALAALDARCSTRHAELSCSLDARLADLADAMLRSNGSGGGDAVKPLRSAVADIEARLEGLQGELDRGLREAAERQEQGSSEREALRSSLGRRLEDLKLGLCEQGESLSSLAAAHIDLQLRLCALDEGVAGRLRERLEELHRSCGQQARRAEESAAACAQLRDRVNALDDGVERLTQLHHEAHSRLALSRESSDQQHQSRHEELWERVSQHADALLDLRAALDQERASRGFQATDLGSRLDKLEAEANGQSALAARVSVCEADVQRLREQLVGEADRLSECEAHGAQLGDLQTAHAHLRVQTADASDRHGLLAERLDGIEHVLGDASMQLRVLRSSQDKLVHDSHSQFGELSEAVASEQEARVACINEVWERFGEFESLVSETDCKRQRECSSPVSQSTTFFSEVSEEPPLYRGCAAPLTERVGLLERAVGKVQGRLDAVLERADQAERQLQEAWERRACELREAHAKAEPVHGGKPGDLPQPMPAVLARHFEEVEAAVSEVAQRLAEERVVLGGRLDGLADQITVESAAREAQHGIHGELLRQEREQRCADLTLLDQRLSRLEGRLSEEVDQPVLLAEGHAQDAPAADGVAGEPGEEALPRPYAEGTRASTPAVRREGGPRPLGGREAPAAVVAAVPVVVVDPRPPAQASLVRTATAPAGRVGSPPAAQQLAAQGQGGMRRVVSPVQRVPRLPLRADARGQAEPRPR